MDRFDPTLVGRDQARARLGLSGSAPLLGVVGQITPWKGQADAIRILARLRARWPDAQLVLAGAPKFTNDAARYDNRAYDHELRQLASEMGLGADVQFLGEREDTATILRALDVLLVPSWEEPFGKVVLEGMSMELPVVATNMGGPAEIVRDGLDGRLLPPQQPARWADTISVLLEQPALRAAMGRNGRNHVKQSFNRDTYLQAEIDSYDQAIAGADARATEVAVRL